MNRLHQDTEALSLGDTGRMFVEEALANGGALAEHVRRLKRVTHVFTLIPEAYRDKAADPRAGGVGISGFRVLFAGYLAAYLRAGENNVLIEEDLYSRSADPILQKEPYVIYGEEVYRFVHARMGDESIERALRLARYPTVIFLTAASVTFERSSRLTSEQIEELLSNTVRILVGAYDEEGFVLAELAAHPPIDTT